MLRALCESPVLIAIGANLSFGGHPPQDTLRAALAEMEAQGVEIIASSRFFVTPCFPPGAGPDYVNAAVAVRMPLGCDTMSLLERFHQIEAQFGRERVQRWGMRTLDIDLLAYGDSVLPDAATQTRWRDLPADAQKRETPGQLILPHPRLQDRAFVLVPLADIAPDWRHPLTQRSVREMLAALDPADVAGVVAL